MFDMTFGGGGKIYAGLTFNETLSVLDSTLTSTGAEDIAILCIDSSMNLNMLKQYGTIYPENVSEVLFDNEVLYFGGYFSGHERERTIGNYKFLNGALKEQKTYISYILTQDNEDAEYLNSGNIKSSTLECSTVLENKILSENETLFEVFPNPTNKGINIQLKNDEIFAVRISNMLAQSLYESKTNGQYVIRVDLNDNLPGIYFVSGLDKYGKVVEIKKIIKF